MADNMFSSKPEGAEDGGEMSAVTAIGHVLRDPASGRYVPDVPLTYGLGLAVDKLEAEGSPAERTDDVRRRA
jgi:hypothetical protein